MRACDIFICHASEDKDSVARPLADALSFLGFEVWYDEYKIRAGASLREAIDRGLRQARMGAVILSPNFLRKGWTKEELDALVTRQARERRTVVLPIWHRIAREQVEKFSPILAARKAILTSDGLDSVVDHVASVLASDRLGGGPVPQRRHVLEFFNAKNDLVTTVVYNRKFKTPTPRAKESTTEVFISNVRSALDTLRRIGTQKGVALRPTNYHPTGVIGLLDQQTNIVAYASSKLNSCTGAILERLDRRYKLGVRFMYVNDVAAKKTKSIFSEAREGERVCLSFQGRILRYRETLQTNRGLDYGVLLRARPSKSDDRLWIVFAGCGRPASVASRLLVFDESIGRPLWRRLKAIGPLTSFATVFEVRYSPKDNTQPSKIRILAVVPLT